MISARVLFGLCLIAGAVLVAMVKRRGYVVLVALLASSCVTLQPDYRPTKPDLRPAPPGPLLVRAAVASRTAL